MNTLAELLLVEFILAELLLVKFLLVELLLAEFLLVIYGVNFLKNFEFNELYQK